MCVVPGAPLQLTFEPGFMQSDAMFYNTRGDQTYRDSILLATKKVLIDGVIKMPAFIPKEIVAEPEHILKFSERRALVRVGAEIAPIATTSAAVDEAAESVDGLMEEAPAPKKPRNKPSFRLL